MWRYTCWPKCCDCIVASSFKASILEHVFNLRKCHAVSYTHLDVYKRQRLHSVMRISNYQTTTDLKPIVCKVILMSWSNQYECMDLNLFAVVFCQVVIFCHVQNAWSNKLSVYLITVTIVNWRKFKKHEDFPCV